MARVTAVCLSSTLQRTVTFGRLIPGQVNRSERYGMYASGKAVNSARVLNQLEAGFASVICPLGERNASRFMELADGDGLPVHGILVPGFTRECWTLLDRENHGTTELVVGEPVLAADLSRQVSELLDTVADSARKTDALLFAGSRPGIWPEDMCAGICRIAAEAGRLVVADFWGPDLIRTLAVCTPAIIKINEEEFCKTFGYDFPQEENRLLQLISEKSRELSNIFIVTRGSSETYAADCGVEYSEPIQPVTVVNSTACGDSFSAGFLYTYLKSGKMRDALYKGTWCAARNAERECPGSII